MMVGDVVRVDVAPALNHVTLWNDSLRVPQLRLLASTISRVGEWRDQEGYVVVLCGVGDPEPYDHDVEQRWVGQAYAAIKEIVANMKSEFKDPFLKFLALKQWRVAATVGVGRRRGNRLLWRGCGIETDADTRGGLAVGGVDYMCGKSTHLCSLSIRRCPWPGREGSGKPRPGIS